MAGKSERLKVHHQQRSDTAANWTANNPVLLAGEMGVESDTFKFKFGDGTSRWSTLPYVNTAGGTGAKGDKGDPGADGAPGKDGVTPAISVTASVSQTTGTPAVEVTQSGTTAAPKFDFAFSGIKGEKGDTGAQGAQGATGAKGDAGAAGKSAYEIWKAQSGNSGKTETEFLASLKGAKGDTGARGPQGDKGETGSAGEQGIQGPTGPAGAAAGFGTPTASVDTGIGTPGVTVTASGPDTAKVFSFAFKNLKGATGAQGVQGAKGETGAPGKDGVTPAISVTASVSQTTGTPAVEVTQSGTTAAPKFDFAFSGIKGEKGMNATTTNVATQSVNGLMSAADKKKLDDLTTGAGLSFTDYQSMPVGDISNCEVAGVSVSTSDYFVDIMLDNLYLNQASSASILFGNGNVLSALSCFGVSFIVGNTALYAVQVTREQRNSGSLMIKVYNKLIIKRVAGTPDTIEGSFRMRFNTIVLSL